MYYNCYDGTYLGGLVSGSSYGYYGGFDSCYDGQSDGCGSGFGSWDDGDSSFGCAGSYPVGCIILSAKIQKAWIGCPASISFYATDVGNGGQGYWSLTFVTNYWVNGYTVWMGTYVGTSTMNGHTAAATGEMVCGAGFIVGSAAF
jgi:hypothetical protein